MRLRMHQKKDDRGKFILIFNPLLAFMYNELMKRFSPLDTRGKGKTDHWSVTGGEFCRFCLFKENRETMEALTHISTMLR